MSNWLSRNLGLSEAWHLPSPEENEDETAYLLNDIGPLLYVYGRKIGEDLSEDAE